MWGSIVRSASGKGKRANIGISISIEEAWNLFLSQNRKCALSGIEIYCSPTNRAKGTASLDRIDSSIGYHSENVQWVHKDINRMKNIFSQEYFIAMCKHVAGAGPEGCEVK